MNTKKKIYCISGLGADYRVFRCLEKEFDLVHLWWISPQKNESLSSYAKRLAEKIPPNEAITLMGVSFGGIIAQEIANIRNVRKLVLVSSFYSDDNISFLFKLSTFLRFNYLFFPSIVQHLSWINNFSFGVKKKSDKRLLKSIIKNTPRSFFIWATNALVKWDSSHCHSSYVSIHGTKDRIIPFHNTCDLTLTGAGHFGIFTHPKKIIQLLL